MNLLVVEDNENVRRLIRRLVADLAEEIYECGDGAGALEAYSRCHPDWVLMDIMMEKVDGLAATREIRAAFPAARIIIVTNHDGDGLRDAARAAGACKYVLKENLIEVRRVLGDQRLIAKT